MRLSSSLLLLSLIVFPLAVYSEISNRIFDTKSIPLTIRVEPRSALQAQTISKNLLPPVTSENLDSGLYIIPKALSIVVMTESPWQLSLKLKAPYFGESGDLVKESTKVLYRESDTQSPFREIDLDQWTLVDKGAPMKLGDNHTLYYDLAVVTRWNSSIDRLFSYPIQILLQEAKQEEESSQ